MKVTYKTLPAKELHDFDVWFEKATKPEIRSVLLTAITKLITVEATIDAALKSVEARPPKLITGILES